MVEYIEYSTDNRNEKCGAENGEDCPETAATAEATVRSTATIVLLRTINLTVWIVKLRFNWSWISVTVGCGDAVNCAVTVGFGRWFGHFVS